MTNDGVCYVKMKFKIPVFICLCICFILLFVAACLCVKPVRKAVSDYIADCIVSELRKEEADRAQKVANGDIVSGKDTVLIWENMYEIGHFIDGDHLEIKRLTDYGYTLDGILFDVTDYKKIKDKLYVKSGDGFAVIDENNMCTVYVTVPDDEFVSGYSMDENGEKYYISEYLENENVTYLKSFDEFSDEDIKVFDNLNGK